jgi:hypothetical protein
LGQVRNFRPWGSITAWSTTPQFFIYDSDRVVHVARVAANLPKGRWIHMAAVSGPGMRLYLNGVEAARNDFAGSFVAIANGDTNYLGRSNWVENPDFLGELDEVRVWRTARSGEQIRATLHATLRGDEPGLAALWNFDGSCGDGPIVRDHGDQGHHGRRRGRPDVWRRTCPTRCVLPSCCKGRCGTKREHR